MNSEHRLLLDLIGWPSKVSEFDLYSSFKRLLSTKRSLFDLIGNYNLPTNFGTVPQFVEMFYFASVFLDITFVGKISVICQLS